MLTATSGNRLSWLRITSRPFGSIYFSNGTRGISDPVRPAGGVATRPVCAEKVVAAATSTAAIASGRAIILLRTFFLFRGQVVEARPQVPARHRTVRTPGFPNTFQAIRRRHLPQPILLLH